jgi:DNA-directed RNA polymerase subunit RPC12/RpoP
MKIREFDCPSCGASLQIKKGQKTLTCPYCDSTVIVPDSFSSDDSSDHVRQTTSVQPTVVFDPGGVKRSCTGVIVSLVIFVIIGVAAFTFYQMKFSDIREVFKGPVSVITGEPAVPVVLEFGGSGMGAGYFQNAEQICVDNGGNIYVGEFEGGKIQIFDANGNYTGQWNFGKSDDIYLRSMALSRDGLLYLVYDSELYIHDASSGELVGSLQHPDGWGFDDVDICDDGSVVASWYCNSDHIIKFAPDGSIDFVIREAISTQSGDSELDTDVEVDGMGNVFAYGSFNESFFKFSPQGRFLDRFGSDGDRPGQFTLPSCFCIDPQGRLWVSDFGDLKVFDNNGTYLDTFDPGMTLFDMVMADGYQLYGITNDETVVQLDLSGVVEDL